MDRLRKSAAALMLLVFLAAGWGLLLLRADRGSLSAWFWQGYIAAKPEDPSFLDKLFAVPAGIENAVENAVKNAVSSDKRWITLHGGFERLIGCEFVVDADPNNNVVLLKNGYLHSARFDAEWADISGNAALLNDFAAYNASLDIPTLFVLAPSKIAKGEDLMPDGAADYGNEEADAFLQLVSKEVDTLDLREAFQRAEGGNAAYFFRTDHHWTPEGGFLAFGQVAERLKTHYGFSFEPALTDRAQYRTELYEGLFLGSQGKRVGPWYAGVDDFLLLLPVEETQNYSYEVPSWNLNIVREGSFEDAFIFYEMLERDHYNMNSYAAYTGGDYPLSIARNENILNGKRVLLIRNSFGCVFAPFLTRICSRLDIIDPRWFEGSIREYVLRTQPDIVIILYHVDYARQSRVFTPLAS